MDTQDISGTTGAVLSAGRGRMAGKCDSALDRPDGLAGGALKRVRGQEAEAVEQTGSLWRQWLPILAGVVTLIGIEIMGTASLSPAERGGWQEWLYPTGIVTGWMMAFQPVILETVVTSLLFDGGHCPPDTEAEGISLFRVLLGRCFSGASGGVGRSGASLLCAAGRLYPDLCLCRRCRMGKLGTWLRSRTLQTRHHA